jgi:hypothetical protein
MALLMMLMLMLMLLMMMVMMMMVMAMAIFALLASHGFPRAGQQQQQLRRHLT